MKLERFYWMLLIHKSRSWQKKENSIQFRKQVSNNRRVITGLLHSYIAPVWPAVLFPHTNVQTLTLFDICFKLLFCTAHLRLICHNTFTLVCYRYEITRVIVKHFILIFFTWFRVLIIYFVYCVNLTTIFL